MGVACVQVEQFQTLFTVEERKSFALKMFEMYCEEGAQWQVNFNGEQVASIKARMDAGDYGEDLFDQAQAEM